MFSADVNSPIRNGGAPPATIASRCIEMKKEMNEIIEMGEVQQLS